MGTKDRIQRKRAFNKANILQSALRIGKEEGWQALSMRKLAEVIEYTPPALYGYFPEGKESILEGLTWMGFARLNTIIKAIMQAEEDPERLVQEMWLAYWRFAFEEKEFYQLMFGVNMACRNGGSKDPESDHTAVLFKSAIRRLYIGGTPTEAEVTEKYYTYWSVVHGLVSINMVNHGNADLPNQQILLQSISAINQSIRQHFLGP